MEALTENTESAPIVRSCLGCLECLMQAQPNNNWSTPGKAMSLFLKEIMQAFATILSLSMDQRPKVRKRAQDAIRSILNAPPPPSLNHPGKECFLNLLKSFSLRQDNRLFNSIFEFILECSRT